MFSNDNRTVLTLDAGGTNFVFSAIQGNEEVVTPITLQSNAYDLKECLDTIVNGFTQVKQELKKELRNPPVAISFAFPGPADYENGIIGDLPNFPSFRGGVALGPFLEKKFGLPVFINNDGNLFTYGEALAGALPEINQHLQKSGGKKRYKNLLGVTIGTGFGGGVVINNVLLRGDNGCGGYVWISANKKDNNLIAEEGVSIRAVKRVYNELASTDIDLTPQEIFEIAEGLKEGNQSAAVKSFEELGAVAGFTIAESLNIIDGLVVIGGGIAHAHKFILSALIKEMSAERRMVSGTSFSRLQSKAYNLMDIDEFEAFINEERKTVKIPETDEEVQYDVAKKTGVIISKLGTSKAIALGAYAYALSKL